MEEEQCRSEQENDEDANEGAQKEEEHCMPDDAHQEHDWNVGDYVWDPYAMEAHRQQDMPEHLQEHAQQRASANEQRYCRAEGCARPCGTGRPGRRHRNALCVDCSHKEYIVLNGESMRYCQTCQAPHKLQRFEGKQRSCVHSLELARRRRRKFKRSGNSSQNANHPVCPSISRPPELNPTGAAGWPAGPLPPSQPWAMRNHHVAPVNYGVFAPTQPISMLQHPLLPNPLATVQQQQQQEQQVHALLHPQQQQHRSRGHPHQYHQQGDARSSLAEGPVMHTVRMKMLSCDPENLPNTLRRDLETWIAEAPASLMSYLNRGCCEIIVDVLLRSGGRFKPPIPSQVPALASVDFLNVDGHRVSLMKQWQPAQALVQLHCPHVARCCGEVALSATVHNIEALALHSTRVEIRHSGSAVSVHMQPEYMTRRRSKCADEHCEEMLSATLRMPDLLYELGTLATEGSALVLQAVLDTVASGETVCSEPKVLMLMDDTCIWNEFSSTILNMPCSSVEQKRARDGMMLLIGHALAGTLGPPDARITARIARQHGLSQISLRIEDVIKEKTRSSCS